MRILVGTPAYGAMISTGYFNSILKILATPSIRDKHQVEVVTIGNDALINRARQEIVKIAMDNGMDKLLFIDADIIFSVDDFLKVIESDKEVIGGTYRKKCSEPILNFNIKKDMEANLREKYNVPSNSLHGYKILRENYTENSIVQAQHLATGFLCINKSVFQKLQPMVDNYVSDRRSNHKLYYNEEEIKPLLVPELFPVRVKNHILESEDWGFCRLCNENNIDIYLHTDVVVGHIGSLPLVFPKNDNIISTPKPN